MDCGHTYHAHCARKWVLDERTCPTCRKGVSPALGQVSKVNGNSGRKQEIAGVDLLSSIKTLEKPKVLINAPMPDIL